VLGSHVLPGIIAQEVLRRPLVALLTHVLAALVASAFNPIWFPRFLGTALLFGLIQEASPPSPGIAPGVPGGSSSRRRSSA
jgi:energy-coupling factor transport system substrate-specific component